MNTILNIENITKSYGSYKALNDVSLQMPEGSIFGLLGPNGAGKTSLIRIINQITMADKGTIYLDNEPLQPKHIQQIGYLPEERGLYKNMKVGEQAIYLAQLKGMSQQDAKKKLKYWFEKFEITDWWNKKIQELSKGMAQKVQFIVTVLHEPKLLIFDEPFSGFDPINANIIKNEILELRDKGASIIFSTHRMESVEEMCDYIALIHKSRKILDGKLIDIKNQFKTNEYEVGMHSVDIQRLKEELSKLDFSFTESNTQQIGCNLHLKFALKEHQNSQDLISTLNQHTTIHYFAEVIPSANDIFLKAILQNE
ncbi:MAG: ATP-binding cassette domain-containing protein [Flavobacteriaceae bacterium]|nr:ATP-binding cassette domain-containing protein [Flavobacteriaceae bacterium]